MKSWKWLCASGCFSVAMVGCTMRDVESPAGMSNEGRPERQSPTLRPSSMGPGISTLSADTDRAQFDSHLIDQLSTIDARVRAISRLYAKGADADKDRMRERMQVVSNRRVAVDENRKMLDMTVGEDWALPKADIVTNLTILEQGLDDLEFAFKK